MSASDDRREDLLRDAETARTRLMRTVERIDERRTEFKGVRSQVKKYVGVIAAVGGLLVVATAGAAVLLTHRIMTAADRKRRARWQLARGLRDMWVDPERELRLRKHSVLSDALRSVLLTALTTAAAIPTKRLVVTLMGGDGARREPS